MMKVVRTSGFPERAGLELGDLVFVYICFGGRGLDDVE
jgi:hypothetical protein